MSMWIDFEPHSWYYGFAIKKDNEFNDPCEFNDPDGDRYCRVHDVKVGHYDNWCKGYAPKWSAFTDDGNTYSIVELHGATIKDIKQQIVKYYFRDSGKHVPVFYEKKLRRAYGKLQTNN